MASAREVASARSRQQGFWRWPDAERETACGCRAVSFFGDAPRYRA